VSPILLRRHGFQLFKGIGKFGINKLHRQSIQRYLTGMAIAHAKRSNGKWDLLIENKFEEDLVQR